MKYLYFPGNSVSNKTELIEFKTKFSNEGLDIYAQEYDHWSDESLSFSLERELNKVIENVHLDSDYVVMGKSMGTLMSCATANAFEKDPRFIILMGIPNQVLAQNLSTYKSALSRNTKSIIIQNENDPYGNVDEIKKMLNGINAEFITKERSDHQYSYANEIWEMVRE